MRKALIASLVAFAVVAPAAPTAFAANPHQCASVQDISPKAYKKAAKKAKKSQKTFSKMVLAGTVIKTDGDKLTFKVHGGPYKCLRNTEVTVDTDSTTKIMRDGVAVALSAVTKDDHVNVKGTKSTVKNVGSLYFATRIAASAPEVEEAAPAPAPAPEPAPAA